MKYRGILGSFFLLLALVVLPLGAADTTDDVSLDTAAPKAESAEAESTEAQLELLPEAVEMMGPPACKNKDKFTTTGFFVGDCDAFCATSCADGGGEVISAFFNPRSATCTCTCCRT